MHNKASCVISFIFVWHYVHCLWEPATVKQISPVIGTPHQKFPFVPKGSSSKTPSFAYGVCSLPRCRLGKTVYLCVFSPHKWLSSAAGLSPLASLMELQVPQTSYPFHLSFIYCFSVVNPNESLILVSIWHICMQLNLMLLCRAIAFQIDSHIGMLC